MNLNPFSHNYLNQLPTSKTIKATPQRSHTPTAKRENKQTQISITQQQNRYKPSLPNSMEEQFLLQPRYMRCNLQYTKEGYLLAFLRKDNIISGRSYIFFPQGILANCNVMNSKLSGWIVICKKGQFYNISHYSTGKLNGVQYIYDLRCGLTIESVYHCGKLETVKRGVADSQISFEKSIKNKELINLLHATLNYQFLERYLPKIQSSLGNYYGAKSKEMPNGLGILITDLQCFYGNFKRGLLSGEGVMIFNNGNSYIGQFQQGMMKGCGQLVKNGSIQFKYNNTLIEQSQFNDQRNISSFYQNEEVASIFHPIISLYQKLKVIYQNRRKDPQQKSQSFVDVEIDNNVNDEQQQEQIYKRSEDSSTPRQNIIEELINTTNSKETQLKNKKNSPFVLTLTPISQLTKEQKKEQTKQKYKEQYPPIKRKKDKVILRDQQWEQIIEELGDESVNKQDGFLRPKKENSRQQSSQINKKSGINSRVDGHNYIGITDNRTDTMDRLQNQLIGKIITRK